MPYLPLGQMPVQNAERSVVTSVENRHEDATQPSTNATRPAADSKVTEEVDQQVAKPKSTAEASEAEFTLVARGAYVISASFEALGVVEAIGALGTTIKSFAVPSGSLRAPIAIRFIDNEGYGVTENPIDTHTAGLY